MTASSKRARWTCTSAGSAPSWVRSAARSKPSWGWATASWSEPPVSGPAAIFERQDFGVDPHAGPLDPVPIAVLHDTHELAVRFLSHIPALARGFIDAEPLAVPCLLEFSCEHTLPCLVSSSFLRDRGRG